jgi:hypothetical protein
MYLSIADIKRDLPEVPVLIDGREYIGHVKGRLNNYATVYNLLDNNYHHFSWDAVARAYNTGEALIFD